MLGWLRFAAACASRRKRSTNEGRRRTRGTGPSPPPAGRATGRGRGTPRPCRPDRGVAATRTGPRRRLAPDGHAPESLGPPTSSATAGGTGRGRFRALRGPASAGRRGVGAGRRRRRGSPGAGGQRLEDLPGRWAPRPARRSARSPPPGLDDDGDGDPGRLGRVTGEPDDPGVRPIGAPVRPGPFRSCRRPRTRGPPAAPRYPSPRRRPSPSAAARRWLALVARRHTVGSSVDAHHRTGRGCDHDVRSHDEAVVADPGGDERHLQRGRSHVVLPDGHLGEPWVSS
jgi:hypothetical protein